MQVGHPGIRAQQQVVEAKSAEAQGMVRQNSGAQTKRNIQRRERVVMVRRELSRPQSVQVDRYADGNRGDVADLAASGNTSPAVANEPMTAEQMLTKRQIETVAEGTFVEGVMCVPKEVELLQDEKGKKSKRRLRIVVGEGRHREVRRTRSQ